MQQLGNLKYRDRADRWKQNKSHNTFDASFSGSVNAQLYQIVVHVTHFRPSVILSQWAGELSKMWKKIPICYKNISFSIWLSMFHRTAVVKGRMRQANKWQLHPVFKRGVWTEGYSIFVFFHHYLILGMYLGSSPEEIISAYCIFITNTTPERFWIPYVSLSMTLYTVSVGQRSGYFSQSRPDHVLTHTSVRVSVLEMQYDTGRLSITSAFSPLQNVNVYAPPCNWERTLIDWNIVLLTDLKCFLSITLRTHQLSQIECSLISCDSTPVCSCSGSSEKEGTESCFISFTKTCTLFKRLWPSCDAVQIYEAFLDLNNNNDVTSWTPHELSQVYSLPMPSLTWSWSEVISDQQSSWTINQSSSFSTLLSASHAE